VQPQMVFLTNFGKKSKLMQEDKQTMSR